MKNMIQVPLIVYESELKSKNNIIKWLLATLIITIIILGVALTMFISFISSYDFQSYEQDGNGINNINTGEQGDVSNESIIEIND